MTLPTPDKTWQFTNVILGAPSVNQFAAGSGSAFNDQQDLMFKIKRSLIGFALSAWSVWGSCNSTAFGNGDLVDRWITRANLIFFASGTAHSWIVLQQAGLGAKTAVCIDLNGGSDWNGSVVFSPAAGFGAVNGGVNGTLTARPTATDEIALVSNAGWGQTNYTFGTRGLHVMQSSDGQCTRVLICRNNLTTGMWIFDKAKNPIAAWTNPVFAGVAATYASSSTSYETTTYGDYTVTTNGWNYTALCKTKIGADTVSMLMTAPWYGYWGGNRYPVGKVDVWPDDTALEWPFYSIGLACLNSPHRGSRKGEVYDLWWTNGGHVYQRDTSALSATFPDTGTRLFAQFCQMIIPWDGLSFPRMG